ncbi:MAG TPA: hypothetical protein VJP78_11145 [Thermoleophilia bacterium]|nr:hypothetical protein [Thermoleophilia bacterium]
MRQFLHYLQLTFIRWRSVYGIIPFLVAAIAAQTGVKLVLPPWAWSAILVASILYSTWLVYREQLATIPAEADLTIECRSVSFGASSHATMPNPPMVYALGLELRNAGAQQGQLTSITVENIQPPTPLFSTVPSRLLLQDTTPSSRAVEVPLPHVVPPEYMNPHMRLEIRVDLTQTDPLMFARGLRQLGAFSITLSYEFKTMRGAIRKSRLTTQGQYAPFVGQMIDRWKHTNEHKLVYAATGIE